MQADFESENDPAVTRHTAESLTFEGLIVCLLRFDFFVDPVSALFCRLTCLFRRIFFKPSVYRAFMESQFALLSDL